MAGLSTAETFGMWSLIALLSFATLLVLAAIGIERQDSRSSANTSPWADTDWPATSYPEPANLADVEHRTALNRARGWAPVIHNPAPLPALAPPVVVLESPYRMPLAELVASTRYLMPAIAITPEPLRVGRHRLVELIAA